MSARVRIRFEWRKKLTVTAFICIARHIRCTFAGSAGEIASCRCMHQAPHFAAFHAGIRSASVVFKLLKWRLFARARSPVFVYMCALANDMQAMFNCSTVTVQSFVIWSISCNGALDAFHCAHRRGKNKCCLHTYKHKYSFVRLCVWHFALLGHTCMCRHVTKLNWIGVA